MTVTLSERRVEEFNLVRGGFSNRVAERLGLVTKASRRSLKVALLLAVTWVPLLLMALASGHLTGTAVKVPFLHDPEVHARFLIVLPLLELAELIVAISLAGQVKHLREMGVVPEHEQGRFEAACAEVLALRGSAGAELMIVVLS